MYFLARHFKSTNDHRLILPTNKFTLNFDYLKLIIFSEIMNYFNALIFLFIQALNYLKFQFQNQTASYYTWPMYTGLPGFTDSNFFYPKL